MLNTADRDAGRLQNGYNAKFTLNTMSLNSPFAEIVAGAATHGFHGLELWSDDLADKATAAANMDLLKAHNLAAPVLQVLRDFEGSPETERRESFTRAESLMAQMLDVGVATLLTCSNTSPLASPERSRIVDDLRSLADMAAARGLRVGYEPLAWGFHINRYEEAAACIAEVNHPALGLVIDAFHWFWAGTPIKFARAIPLDKCFDMQICNVRDITSPAIEVARHRRCLPHDGIWPVGDLVREFLAYGYDQPINLEVFNDDLRELPADMFAARAMASIRQLLK